MSISNSQTLDITQYLAQRIQPQIEWFEKNSRINKLGYQFTKTLLTFLAAISPALAAFIHDDSSSFKIALAISTILTAVLANLSTIFNFKDKYITFRDAAENLKSEVFLYQFNAGKYKDNPDGFNILVVTIEDYLKNINQNWKKMLDPEKDTNR